MPQADPETPRTEGEIDIEALLADPAERKDNVHDIEPGIELLPEDEQESEDDDLDVDDEVVDEEPSEGDAAGPAGAAGQAIGADCRGSLTAVHESGHRPVSEITHIVIHSTEGPTAKGGATWFTNPESKGSAHLVLDDLECFRTLADDVIPFGAPGANTNGFHIEHAGFAKWNRRQWLQHRQTLRRGAFKAAFHAKKFDVPLVVLTPQDLRNGKSGFCTHAAVSEAFKRSDHTDPGTGFPLDLYMRLVKKFFDKLPD